MSIFLHHTVLIKASRPKVPITTPEALLSQGSRRVSKRPRQALAEVLECHHLSGADSFIIKAAASSVSHLETIVARFSAYGQTTTSIVLSSSLPGRSARRELTGDQAENH